MDIHSKYPIAAYRKGLMAIGTQQTSRVMAYLGEIESLVDAYAMASVSLRRELFTEMNQQIKKCYSALGQAQAAVPRTLVYEDTMLNPRKLAISEVAWSEILSNVAEFQHLLPVFDINFPRKIITKGYFRARYGAGQRCDDFLSFANEFRQDFFEQYLQGIMRTMNDHNSDEKITRRQNYFKQPEIEMLDDARQATADYVSVAYENLPSNSKELILSNAFFDAISPHIPKNTGKLHSHTFFSQFAQVNSEPLLIVNHTYTGLALMFSRFAHCFSEDEGYQFVPKLRAYLERLQPPGAVFAELKGGYDATNLNLHPQFTSYELVCSGDSSLRPTNEQIPLEDLYIQDDDRQDYLRLYSKLLGKEIIPLYLGFLLPMALPEIQQVLLNFSYATMCSVNLWKGTKTQNAEDTIVFYPRLRYKNIVLQRAHWKIHSTFFPQRESGQSDADFYLNVLRWHKQNSLPSRVFVAPEASRMPRTLNQKPERNKLSYKPLYVDFDNYFSVSLLEATVHGASNQLVMTEMLPHRDHLWLKHDGYSYVSEFVWEMNRYQGDHDEKRLG